MIQGVAAAAARRLRSGCSVTVRTEPKSRRVARVARLARRAGGVAVALAAFALPGCAAEAGSEAPEPDAVASSEDAILGGGVENGWPAVGMLRFASGNFGSGALIAPTIVLTAAHVAGGNPTHFYYGTPPAGKAPTHENLRAAPVAEIYIHPCYEKPKSKDCPADVVDVAIVRLARPVTDVEPLRVIEWPLEYFWGKLSPYEGESCVAVGFGAHLSADKKVTFGTRRSARSTVKSVDDSELVTVRGTGIATSGDSGGPLVCGGRIIGTVRGASGGLTPGSPYERSREAYERSDLWRGWIATTGRR
jgi:hypothetical protein